MAFFSEELAWSADWQPTYDGDAPMPMPLLQGDPYHSDGPDAMRGVVMDPAMLGGDWPDAGLNEKLWLDGSLDIGGRKLGGGFSDMRAADEDCARDFRPGEQPRLLPSEPLFRLEATTLLLQARSAHFLGNAIIDFLRDHAPAVPWMRVRHAKFSIRAEVCSGDSPCTVKLRVYAGAAPGLFVVELQRRRGDAVAFARLFRKLAGFLPRRGCGMVAMDPSLGFACFGEAVEDGDDTPSPIAGAGVDSDDGELVDHRAVGLAREVASWRLGAGAGFRALAELVAAGHGEAAMPVDERKALLDALLRR